MDVTVNETQRLYVIPCGSGFTCLGFQNAYKRASAVAAFAGVAASTLANVGTLAGYDEYAAIMTAGAAYAARTGERCESDLTPALIGLEGCRVEVHPGGLASDARRFWVGRSTGWMPCHLEIARRSRTHASGGPAAMVDPGDVVKFIRAR